MHTEKIIQEIMAITGCDRGVAIRVYNLVLESKKSRKIRRGMDVVIVEASSQQGISGGKFSNIHHKVQRHFVKSFQGAQLKSKKKSGTDEPGPSIDFDKTLAKGDK